MIKKFVFSLAILLFSYSFQSSACSCSSLETTSNKYQQSDFVGIVTISKTYKNEVDSVDRYKADVSTVSLFKGKAIRKLTTEGFNGIANRYSSCGVYLEEGKNYLIYGVNNGGETIAYYCGVFKYFNPTTEFILNALKKHVSHIKVDTRWGRTTYIPYQLYLSYNPDSTKHLSLIKLSLNTENGSIGIKHLTADSEAFKKRMKTVITKEINWESKLSKTHYPESKYTFILEIYPYTSSKELREELKEN